MHLVNPRHGQCVTCTVLRAIMFCYDANSCLRFTFEVAIKQLSLLVLMNMRLLNRVHEFVAKHKLLRSGVFGRVASRCLLLTFVGTTKCLSLCVMK